MILAEREAQIGNSGLVEKNLDLVVANDVTQDVFDSDYNTATLVTHDGETPLPRMTKVELAQRILDVVQELRVMN